MLQKIYGHIVRNMERINFFKDTIPPPSRSPLTGAVAVLLVVAALSLAMAMPGRAGKPVLALLALLLPIALVSKSVHAIHLILFGLLWIVLLGMFPFFQIWPLSLLIPLTAYGAVVLTIPQLRRSVGWLHAGRFGRNVVFMVIATIVISSMALIAWDVLAKPDLSAHLALMPEMPLWLFPIAAIGFAFFNAAMEEVIFRGIMMEALDSAIGAGRLSVVIQAGSFGALHYLTGFPNGAWGVAMVFIYGVFPGAIRRQSQGLLAPWAAHVMADITIFGILTAIILRYA